MSRGTILEDPSRVGKAQSYSPKDKGDRNRKITNPMFDWPRFGKLSRILFHNKKK